MNPQEIKEFLKSINDTDIEEMEYYSGDDSLYFKKNDVNPSPVIIKEPPIDQAIKKEEKVSNTVAIKSTMVGTFSSAQSDDKPPFVKVGDDVIIGQKVGQVEAMKIIKDVNSSAKGKISKILVSNGESVEYGQELFLINTSK